MFCVAGEASIARKPASFSQGPGAHYERQLLFFLLPYLFGAFLLFGVPVLLTIGLSFFTYDGLSRPAWSGFFNFTELQREPLFRIALINSLTFIFLAIPLRLLIALGLALIFNGNPLGLWSRRQENPKQHLAQKFDGDIGSLYRSAIYLPTLVPEIAYALLWLWILNPFYGPVNQLIRSIGLQAPAWLVNPQTALPSLVWMYIFTIGEAFIILLAVLRSIPVSIYEAAWVDGSNKMQTFRWITLPLLQPWLILLFIRDLILSFQNTFTPAYIMTGGGPYYATLFLPLLILEEAFDRLRFGVASAMILVMLIMTALLLGLLFGILQNWGDIEGGITE